MPTAGYSPRPLWKKLGIKDGFLVKLIHPPEEYVDLLGGELPDFEVSETAESEIDMIHFFTNDRKELERELPKLEQQIKRNGIIWVSWYKKAAKLPTEIIEDNIRGAALALKLVDVKVCAVDHRWSGLKLMIRKEYR